MNLIPRSFFNLAPRWPSLFDDDDWMAPTDNFGLSVYEDTKNVTVEAAVPGVPADKLEVTFNQGLLWIHGAAEEKEEDKRRKYYRRSGASFSYRCSVPGQVDMAIDPAVSYKDGVVKVVFNKTAEEAPKRLPIKAE